MKQSIITLTFLGLVGTCALNADQRDKVVIKDTNEGTKILILQTSSRDRLFWGPEVFYTNESPQIQGIQVKDNSVYYGLRVGYDFLRPNAVYAGADLLYALGRMHIRTTPNKTSAYKDKATGTFSNAEVRLGYNFHSQEKFYFTPFLGLGGYHTRPQSLHYVQNWLYGAMGMKTDYEINRTFNVGLNLKGTLALYLEQRLRKHHHSVSRHDSSNALGYEVSLPLTMRLGKSQSWDIRAVPYYLKLNSESNANVIGGQITFNGLF